MFTRIVSVLWLSLVLAVSAAAPLSAQERSGRDLNSEAAQAWRFVDASDSKELETFIKHFGDTFYGDLARNKLEKLSKTTVPVKKGKVEGTYDCRGVNPNGTTYRGTVSISSEGNRYRFVWRISSGQVLYGAGTLQGSALTVDWGDKHPVIYKVGNDGTLRGKWANGTATEDLVPVAREY